MTNYGSILSSPSQHRPAVRFEADVEESMFGSISSRTGGRKNNTKRKRSLLQVLIGGMAVVVLSSILVVVILAVQKSSSVITATTSTEAAAVVTMMTTTTADTTTPASCTFKECYASNCNHDVAPFTCLFHNGGIHGGCSSTPWLEGTCTTQCDLTECARLTIPDDTVSCDTPCDDDTICVGFGERLCPDEVPYQCTAGSAKFGCNAGKLEWTLRTSDDTCYECCNTQSCK